MSQGAVLRRRLSDGNVLMAPGVYGGLSAKLAAQAGFEAIYMTGFGICGSTLGMPDIGLMTATEMADRARALAEAAAPVPLIADADNGHGGDLNAARMMRLRGCRRGLHPAGRSGLSQALRLHGFQAGDRQQ